MQIGSLESTERFVPPPRARSWDPPSEVCTAGGRLPVLGAPGGTRLRVLAGVGVYSGAGGRGAVYVGASPWLFITLLVISRCFLL